MTIDGPSGDSVGAAIDLTAFKSGLYWVKVPFAAPTTICFPFGLQQKHL